MVIELNSNPLSDHTERYRAAGLSLEFLQEITFCIRDRKVTLKEKGDTCHETV